MSPKWGTKCLDPNVLKIIFTVKENREVREGSIGKQNLWGAKLGGTGLEEGALDESLSPYFL